MLTTTPTSNNVQMIISALAKKSKRTLSYREKSLKKQAEYFSPAYRDFIYKVISNNSLKIVNYYKDGHITDIDKDPEIQTKLSKRRKNKIYTDISEVDTLPHELGHAVDFWFGENIALTKTVLIENSKTLYDIFTEEFESKYQELYELVMNEYKDIINSNIKENAYEILIENMPKYRELNSIRINLKDKETTSKRRKIQKELYKSEFVEVYYQLIEKKCYQILNTKYSPILDALSSKFDFEGLCLSHHKNDYYKYSKYNAVYEFFANAFEAKVTSKHCEFENLIKHLPKSFNAFEKLFVIFYDHIQNNKRFTDVELKKVSERYE